jgi:putative flippase GtrA
VNERAAHILATHREKILYLFVGGWNTLFTYISFVVLFYLLNPYLHPSVILVLGYLVASVNGFIGFRYIVFGPAGHPLMEYLKYQFVYLPLLIGNMILLPLLLKHTSLNAYLIEALYGALSIVLGYIGNKYFTFRRVEKDLDA